MILKDNNRKSNSMLRPLKSCENYRCVTENIASRYKEGNNSTINIHGNENNNNVDNKVSGYLNSLYRHNFNNSSKSGGTYFLNKNQGLLEELFPNKNNSFYMSTENEQLMANEGNKNKSSKKRENNSTERRSSYKKNNNVRNNYGTKNNSTSKRYKSKYLDTNNSTKKRNKDNSYLENNEKNKYNTINNGARKNKPKKPIIYSKRSPFIANKV